MVRFASLYLLALARGLTAHSLSLPLEAALHPFVPPHACGLVAVVLAVVVVETAWVVAEFALRRRGE